MPTYTYNVSANLSLVTTVSSQGSGTNNVATVTINFSGTPQWSGVMLQASPVATVLNTLTMGSGSSLTVVEGGSMFTLTVPTTLQSGNVVANMSYMSSPNPQTTLTGQISTWTTSSA